LNEIIEALESLGGVATFKQIFEITKIHKVNLTRRLNTHCRRGEMLKTWSIVGYHRYGHVGILPTRQFVFSLPTISTPQKQKFE